MNNQYEKGYGPAVQQSPLLHDYLQPPEKGYDADSAYQPVTAQNNNIKIINAAERMFADGFQAARTFSTQIQDTLAEKAGLQPEAFHPDALAITVLLGTVAGAKLNRVRRNVFSWLKDKKTEFVDDIVDLYTPNNFGDEREKLARQLLLRGHASVDEILKASYGEWPPKGLNIHGSNPQRVNFTDVIVIGTQKPKPAGLKEKWHSHVKSPVGIADMQDERRIGINKTVAVLLPALKKKSTLSSVMGHEGVHILQGDHMHRLEASFGKDALNISKHLYERWSQENRPNLFEQYTTRRWRESLSAPENADLLKRINYLRDSIEIEARLHQVLSNGYRRWGMLPQNREQLLTAMANSGFDIPSEIMLPLEQSPTIVETKQIFAKHRSGPVDAWTSDISLVANTLSDEGEKKFWNDFIPQHYSRLLEIYGDEEGGARFGYGKNLLHQFRLHAAGQPSEIPALLQDLEAGGDMINKYGDSPPQKPMKESEIKDPSPQ